MGHGSIVFEGTPDRPARRCRRSARSGWRSERRSALVADSDCWRRLHGAARNGLEFAKTNVRAFRRAMPVLRSSSIPKESQHDALNYKVRGDVAVITLNNPPVNGLGYATRVGIADGLDKAQRRRGRQGDRDHRRRQGLLGRRRHQGVRLAEGDRRSPTCCRVILALESSHQAGRRGDPLGLHGRRPRAGAGLPLPRRRARHQRRAARSEARPDPRRRRHAAPAARARRRDRAQHDRQRRAGQERAAGAACRARSCSTSWPRRPIAGRGSASPSRKAVADKRGRCRWCATCRASIRRATPTSSSRATWSAAWRRTSRRRSSASTRSQAVDQDEVRRRHGRRARALHRADVHARIAGAAPPLHGRARRLARSPTCRKTRRSARSRRSA